VAGSGIKPFAQKGRGKARVGNKRANFRKGGAPAHGRLPRDYSISFNSKMRLFALKSLLSAKLYEERIIFINEETLKFPKTGYLKEIIAPFEKDKLLFLTSFE
jgi:large subunit ribosomal protein L4